MNEILRNDLIQVATGFNGCWRVYQNNGYDKATDFIYSCQSSNQVIEKCLQADLDPDYALHRWYNYVTSIECEKMFTKNSGVVPAKEFDHDKDFVLFGDDYDLKLTVYPKKLLSYHPYNIARRSGKDAMIQWLYRNQSQGKRKQALNRIYVMIEADTYNEAMLGKSRFELIEPVIQRYVKWYAKNGGHEISIKAGNNDTEARVLSEVLRVRIPSNNEAIQ